MSRTASVALASVSALAISAAIPAHAQVYSWSGFYIGGNAGGSPVTTAAGGALIGKSAADAISEKATIDAPITTARDELRMPPPSQFTERRKE
jgi:hypothetical protein